MRLPLSFIVPANRRQAGPKWPWLGKMKPDELFRNVPANVHELRLAIAGLPKDMKVIAHSETGISEKTVDELRERTTWLPGLVVTTPREIEAK
jgi:hypothetical protein